MSPQAKPSRIPTPASTTRPLPSQGYVSDGVVLPKPHPPSSELVQSQNKAPTTRPTKTITIELHGNTEGTFVPSRGKCSDSATRTHRAAENVKSTPSKTVNHKGIETRKKHPTKTNTVTDKNHTTTKQTRGKTGRHKQSNSWANRGRMNELRIRSVSPSQDSSAYLQRNNYYYFFLPGA